jgi:hypothetical protein
MTYAGKDDYQKLRSLKGIAIKIGMFAYDSGFYYGEIKVYALPYGMDFSCLEITC